jgi:hypothetical protein
MGMGLTNKILRPVCLLNDLLDVQNLDSLLIPIYQFEDAMS